MAYTGSVELISGITQKNGENFPLIDASAVYVDDGTRLPDALETKDDKMEIWSLWPVENLFRKNGMYSLGMVTGDKSISFEDGTGAEDMIYIAFLAGEDMMITMSGSNYIGLSGFTELESGGFAELIGLWNPSLEKWVFTWRSMGV